MRDGGWIWPLIVSVVIVGLIILNWSWSVSKEEIVGIYVNTNYDQPHCCLGAPHEPDTLVLRLDGSMSSAFYGNGTWDLTEHGTEIRWEYPFEYGTDREHQHVKGMGVHVAVLDNEIGKGIRILLNYERGHYYQKVR